MRRGQRASRLDEDHLEHVGRPSRGKWNTEWYGTEWKRPADDAAVGVVWRVVQGQDAGGAVSAMVVPAARGGGAWQSCREGGEALSSSAAIG